MSYNGSGTFVINTAGQPVVSGTVISSTAFNALTADLATGLSTAITKDGQTTPTANIPMGNNKITGLAVGTAATDAATLSQVQSTVAKLLASVSGTDTITAVASPTLAAYAAGQMFYFVAAGANTGAVTLNINSLGAKSVTRDGTTALASGDIQSGEVCVVVYDGTQFQLVNGASQSASIVTENLTVNKATVLNESGGDNDTRIEGDTDANLVFVDASADKVGIGTSSPLGKLGIAGSATATIIIPRSSNGSTASPVETQLIGSTFTNGTFEAGVYALNSFLNTSANWLAFKTTDAGNTTATRMVLDQSGNLGLGVTPSAWDSGKVLEINQLGTAVWGNGVNNFWFTSNAYYNGSNFKYGTGGGNLANAYQMVVGQHRWYTAPAGTNAGDTITFTQAMTLDASNNLLLGTTSSSYVTANRTSFVVNGTNQSLLGLQTGGTNKGYLYSDGTNILVYSESASGYMAFGTNNTERARITSGGFFKASNDGSYLGSTSSYHELKNTTSDAPSVVVQSTNASYTDNCLSVWVTRNTTNNSFYALGYYNVGAAAYKWRVADSGNVTNTNGSYGTISDAKMKTDIVDAGSQWDDLKAVRFRKFKMKDDPSGITQLGVVAQELEQTSPGLVEEHQDKDADGNDLGTTTKSVKTSILLMKAAVALQEAMTRIEQLEAKVAALEAK